MESFDVSRLTRFGVVLDGVVESAFDSALTAFVFRALLVFGKLLFLPLGSGVFFSTEAPTDLDLLRFEAKAVTDDVFAVLSSKSIPELDVGVFSAVVLSGPFLILSNSASVSSSSAGSNTPSRIVGFTL